jgi:hypothetical protein
MEVQGTLFEQRFFQKYAGRIVSDPVTAVIELVANCWDAYATEVDIEWPHGDEKPHFRISDNGCGMSRDEFLNRWPVFDYDRLTHQGEMVSPPDGSGIVKQRRAFGRNGKGRHAAFCFANPYEVITRQDGNECRWKVSLGEKHNPIKVQLLEEVETDLDNGCIISGMNTCAMLLPDHEIRSIISTRFLTSPDFKVVVNGIEVTFADVPDDNIKETKFPVGAHGDVRLVLVDSRKSDRTMKQHGVAWRVNNRLVGEPNWSGFEDTRILDGRSEEARRYTIFVFADFLAPAVKEDWSHFDETHALWKETYPHIAAKIKEIIHEITYQKRQATKAVIRERHAYSVNRLDALGRQRWNNFVEDVVEKCPTIAEPQLDQLAGILANLEEAQSKYSLLERLHTLQPNDLDNLDEVLRDWTVKTAKGVLDEIKTRLKLIEEIRSRTGDEKSDELHDLQPLFDQGLWIFGPEFEAVEFTSNKGMTAIIQKLLKAQGSGSLKRPDYVILPDSSLGFYSRPSYDDHYQENGIDTLVIVDLKRPGIPIGERELSQVWQYCKELLKRGQLREECRIRGYVLGDNIAQGENEKIIRGNTTIEPLLYTVFLKRAESRMLNLHKKVKEAPFMTEGEADDFLAPTRVKQGNLTV